MLLKNLNLRVDDGVRLIDDFLNSTEFAKKNRKTSSTSLFSLNPNI